MNAASAVRFFCAFALCIGAAFYCAWQAVAVSCDPTEALVASPHYRSVGLTRQGRVVSASFELRNVSSRLVDIVAITHTCTCTSHTITSLSLAPNEAATLAMSMNTKYRHGTVGASSFIEYREHGTNEQVRRLTVGIGTEIDPDYEARPAAVVFRKREAATRSLRLVPRHVASVRVTRVECDQRCFSATAAQMDRTAQISVKYSSADDYPDNTGGTLKVQTDCPNEPIIAIPLSFENSPQ